MPHLTILDLPHLTAVLDIVLVAVVVYQALLVVRGTRASQMLAGLALLALLYYLAGWGRLITLHWLLSAALPYLVFALIVLFQAELRQGLARIGISPLLRRLTRAASPGEGYEDIVLAVAYLAANRIGGLIVLERETGLRTYVESGVALDAVLSYDLLVTVFRPGGPLHDGAVIVQGNRIAAASCFLPISMDPILSAQLGTRHRAAIGISEETDAIALVVSETSGAISLAVGGKVELGLQPDRLRERLSRLLRRYVAPLALPASTRAPEAGPPSAPGPLEGAIGRANVRRSR